MEAFFFKQAEDELVKLMYEESGKISLVMGKLEELTGQKRETLSRVIGACVGLYLVFGHAAGLLCNIIGFAYPCYASMLAIESHGTDDDTQWLTYWTVFALFSLADFFSEIIMGWMPLYWLAKCILLLWLYLPFTRGAQRIYVSHVRPALLASQRGPPPPQEDPTQVASSQEAPPAPSVKGASASASADGAPAPPVEGGETAPPPEQAPPSGAEPPPP